VVSAADPYGRNLGSVRTRITITVKYSASHSRVAPENIDLQKERKCNTFACHTCNEAWLCVLGIREKEVGNTKR
jgi:hypothetical protein